MRRRREKSCIRTFVSAGSLGAERRGPDECIDYMRSIHAALANFTCAIDDLIAIDRRAAARMTFSGVHRGRLFSVEATGREIRRPGAAFFTTDGRQITTLWVLGDVDSVKQQLNARAGSRFSARASQRTATPRSMGQLEQMVGRENKGEHDRNRRAEANEHVAGRIDLARIVMIETGRRRIPIPRRGPLVSEPAYALASTRSPPTGSMRCERVSFRDEFQGQGVRRT
jgi:predicted ester cyclase